MWNCPRLPKCLLLNSTMIVCYLISACRNRYQLVETELLMIARRVARDRSGRARADRERYERYGTNIKTLLNYMHVLRIWVDVCLTYGVFHLRWKHAVLSSGLWCKLAVHMHNYSNFMPSVTHVTVGTAHTLQLCSSWHQQRCYCRSVSALLYTSAVGSPTSSWY